MTTCIHCQREIESDSTFCRFCGARTGTTPPPVGGRQLMRRPDAGRIGGVCAGIAEYLDTDVALVRLLTVILALVPGAVVGGIVVYLAAWLIIPPIAGPTVVRTTGRQLFRSIADQQIAGVCGGLAAYLGVDSTVMRLIWVVLSIVPGGIILGVIAYLVAWFIIPEAEIGRVHPTAA